MPVSPELIAGAGKLSFLGGEKFSETKFGQSKLGKVAAFGAIGTIGGMGNLVGNKKRKEAEKLEAERLSKLNEANKLLVLNQSKQLANTFPINGVDSNTLYRDGGQLPDNINIDKDKIKKITDDLFMIKGETHENNGVKVDTDGDNIKDAEVERGEVYQDSTKRIFSNNLKPTEALKSQIGKLANFEPNSTYADITEKISKKIKDTKDSGGKFDKDTKEIENNKLTSAIDLTFEDQESSKVQEEEIDSFKNGGEMKKYNDGGAIGDQLLNLGSYISNKRRVKSLQTKRNPTLIPNPVYNYKDNSGRAKSELDVSASNAVRSINRGSSQNNSRAIAKVMANKFDTINDINTTSAVNENNANNQYLSRLGVTQAQNAGIVNETAEANLARSNQQKALLNNAQTAFTDGIVGNLQTAKQNKMQGAELLLTAVKEGDRGTITRLLQQYPDLAKTLGIDLSKMNLNLPTKEASNLTGIGLNNFNPTTVGIQSSLNPLENTTSASLKYRFKPQMAELSLPTLI